MQYQMYIRSDKWRTNPARLAELNFANGRCRICSDKAAPLEVHHATYERLGQEAAGDLLALCHDCHVKVTSFLRRRRYGRRSPRRADLPHTRDTRRSLIDPTRK